MLIQITNFDTDKKFIINLNHIESIDEPPEGGTIFFCEKKGGYHAKDKYEDIVAIIKHYQKGIYKV